VFLTWGCPDKEGKTPAIARGKGAWNTCTKKFEVGFPWRGKITSNKNEKTPKQGKKRRKRVYRLKNGENDRAGKVHLKEKSGGGGNKS